MGLLNWVASKAFGVPSAGEECNEQVRLFLEKHGIEEVRFSYLTGEQSLSYTQTIAQSRPQIATAARAAGANAEITTAIDSNDDGRVIWTIRF